MNITKNFLNLMRIVSVVFFLIASIYGAAGDIDTSFNSSAYDVAGSSIAVIKPLPDGKILVGGGFTDIQGFAVSAIARFNADGSIDTSFISPDFFNGSAIGNYIYAIGIQSDGKIIVGGDIYGVNGVFAPGLRRLNPDGSLDTSFNVAPLNTITVRAIEIQPDNKIVIGGNTGLFERFNADGSLDNTFTNQTLAFSVRDIELQPDGKIVVGGANALRRFNANGALDSSFANVDTNNTIEAVELLPDGKILIGGAFTLVNGFNQGKLSQINTDGSLDLNFNLNNPGTDSAIYDIVRRPDGKIFIAGVFTTYNLATRRRIALLNSDATLDTSFQIDSTLNNISISDIELLANGKILVGLPNIFFAPTINALIQLNSNGTIDSSFNSKTRGGGKVHRILQQPDGKILIGGTFATVNGVVRSSIARLNTDGSVDTTFVPYFNGCCGSGGSPVLGAMILQPDGKILMTASGVGFVRLNADGSKDNSFTYSGSVGGECALLPNGQMICVGGQSFTTTNIAQRLNSNGSVDSTFPSILADGPAKKVVIQPDGKILIGGSFTQVAGGFFRGRIARFNADGTLDNTFNPPGGANGDVNDIDLQPDGKVVLAGAFTALNGNTNIQTIGRLNANGTLDASFIQRTNSILFAVKIQPDGKILIGGSMSTVGNQYRIGIARLNSDGAVDLSFDASTNKTVWDVNLQSDGKILLGGEFTRIKGASKVRVARLLNQSAPTKTLFDYDGDHRADISIFRASENKWYVLRSSDGVVVQQVFAISNDVPVPSDFDGDGKTDFAIFRPSSGDWWYLSSLNSQQVFAHWGENGVIPRPSDFDGDGKSDHIFFLPSNSTWYRFGSSVGANYVSFGLTGDKPVIGDFDGDGKSDVAIFRPSTGDWWWQSSVDNVQRATHWGISTDIPAPADYDGDGKTDFAVYRPSTGVWYIYNSATLTSTVLNFGISEDKPVPADYDGDGKSDIAVFRPSTGVWYLMKSTEGFAAIQFGVATDIPTPNAFVP